MTRNEEIDKLRAVAILATIYAHIADLWMWKISMLEKMQHYAVGYDGVLLFFTISGYVISASLVPKLDAVFARGENGAKVLSAFFCKRIFRITPTCVLWIVITLITTSIVDPASFLGNFRASEAALLNYFNIYAVMPGHLPNSFGVYWSLSLEEQFYIALPVILICFRAPWKRLVALAALIVVTQFNGIEIASMFQIPAIAAGVIIYILESRYRILDPIRRRRGLFGNMILAIFASTLIIGLFVLPLARPYTPHYLLISAPLFALLIYIAAARKNFILPFWGIRFILRWLGTRSFILYLVHLPMIMIIRFCWMIIGPAHGHPYGPENNVPIFVTWLIATIVITELTHQCIEKPMMDKGHRIAGIIETEGFRVAATRYRALRARLARN